MPLPFPTASASPWEFVLVGLLAILAIALPYHDWIPLGHLNNVRGLRDIPRQGGFGKFALVTLLQAIPLTALLYFSLKHFGRPRPDDLTMWLWGYLSVMFVLELRAFWIPYLVVRDDTRAARYRMEFANTHAFLPMHNGMVPNTLHVGVHVLVAATLVALFMSGR